MSYCAFTRSCYTNAMNTNEIDITDVDGREDEINDVKNIYITFGIDPETAEKWAIENAAKAESERSTVEELLAFFDRYNDEREAILGDRLELHVSTEEENAETYSKYVEDCGGLK